MKFDFNGAFLFVFALLLYFLFHGEPDIFDALSAYVMRGLR